MRLYYWRVRLAQINIARMRAGPDSPVMAGFMAVVDPVYRIAEDSPGFRMATS